MNVNNKAETKQVFPTNNTPTVSELPEDVFNIIFSKLDNHFEELACVNTSWNKKMVVYAKEAVKSDLDDFVMFTMNSMAEKKAKAILFLSNMKKEKSFFNVEISKATTLFQVSRAFDNFRKSLLNRMNFEDLPEIEKLITNSNISGLSARSRNIFVYLKNYFNLMKTASIATYDNYVYDDSPFFQKSIMELIDTNQIAEVFQFSNTLSFIPKSDYYFIFFELLLRKMDYKNALKVLENLKRESIVAGSARYVLNIYSSSKALYLKSLSGGDLEVALQTVPSRNAIIDVIRHESWKKFSCGEKIRLAKKLNSLEDREFICQEEVKRYIEQDKFDEAMEMSQLMTDKKVKEDQFLKMATDLFD